MGVKIIGIGQLNKSLRRSYRGVRANIRRGMSEAMKSLKTKAASVTPVESGDLVKSLHRQVFSSAKEVKGVVWYDSPYANRVHSFPGTLKGLPRKSGIGRYWDPNSNPGFLVDSLIEKQNEIAVTLINFAGKDPNGTK